jgi:thioredoxin reductase
MAATWDAIVIGGGHNGLVAGAYLAKAGARTVVLRPGTRPAAPPPPTPPGRRPPTSRSPGCPTS